MEELERKIYYITMATLITVGVLSFFYIETSPSPYRPWDYKEIRKDGTIRFVTDFSMPGYFIDGDSTTVGRLLHESDDVESVVDADNRTLRLNLKNGDRNIEITVDANTKTLQVREAEPKADSTPEAGIPKTEASKAK